MINSWMNLTMLTLESQQVILLRTLKLAGGGAGATAEADRMVTEKVTAAQEAAFSLMQGKSTDSIIASYRRKVRSNARRLGGSLK